MLNSEYLNNLNENQKEATLCIEGPLLIVAGAGSGKTRVLTSRIAHIIKQHKAFPNQILAVTFTNKAAKEMQLRVSKLLRKEATGLPWLGTFHSISAKILRKHADAVGLKSNFSIIDQADQERLIKNICKAENVDTKKISPKYILAVIDKWKNKGLYPDDVILKKKDILEKGFLKIYKIKAKSDKKNVGIWYNNNSKIEKVAAIGVRISKWIAYHGFSININNDLKKYKAIIPCGIKDKGVTNLYNISNQSFENIDDKIIENFTSNLKNLNV